MVRCFLALVLIAATLALGGCSGGYYVDLAQVRQQRVATLDDVPRRATKPRPSKQARRAQAKAAPDDGGAAGAERDAGDSDKGWPEAGSPEAERLRAQEIEREKRIDTLLRSICRGC